MLRERRLLRLTFAPDACTPLTDTSPAQGGTLYRLFNPVQCSARTAAQDCVRPLLAESTPLHLLAFVSSTSQRASPAQLLAAPPSHCALVLNESGVVPSHSLTLNLTLPLVQLGTRAGGQLHAHVFLWASGSDDASESAPLAYVFAPLLRALPVKARSAKLLLSGATALPDGECSGAGNGSCSVADAPLGSARAEEPAHSPHSPSLAPHLRPSLALRLAYPTPALEAASFPGELSAFVLRGDASQPGGHLSLRYRPLLALDEMSVTKIDYRLLSPNASTPDPVVLFSVTPCSLGAFTLYSQLGASLSQLQRQFGLSEDDTDEMRAMVSGGNLKWWALTTAISALHAFFSYLAFSNDVGFWRGKSSLEGLSIRSFFSSLVCQCIIFLKLLDGGNVSWLILGEVGIGCAIEAWKVSKIMRRRGMWSLAYWRGQQSASKMSQLESDTDEADARAMRWLLYGMYPVIMVWGVYSLLKHPQRSWWSWFVKTAAYGVYLYGFVAMLPQLYINHRLKSVAHMPWKVMMYKACAVQLCVLLDAADALLCRCSTRSSMTCSPSQWRVRRSGLGEISPC